MGPKRGNRGKRKNSEKISKNEEQELEQDKDIKLDKKEDKIPDSEKTETENVKTKGRQIEQTNDKDEDTAKNKPRKRKKSRSKSSEREYDKKKKEKVCDDKMKSNGEDEVESGSREDTCHKNRQNTHQQDSRYDTESRNPYRGKTRQWNNRRETESPIPYREKTGERDSRWDNQSNISCTEKSWRQDSRWGTESNIPQTEKSWRQDSRWGTESNIPQTEKSWRQDSRWGTESNIPRTEKSWRQDSRLDTERYVPYGEKTNIDRPLIVKTDEEVLMILTHPSEICLKGKCQLASLCGRVTVLGYHVTPSVKSCDFYSPESNSLLTIKTIDTDNDNKVYNDICAKYLDKKMKKKLPKQENGVILQLRKLDSVMCDYITKLNPFQQLFTVSEYISDNIDLVSSNVDVALIAGEVNLPRIRISEDFCYLADTYTDALDKESAPIVVVCGGKNSGKSTLNRFLINTALNKAEGIFYLECDVGQTEFTPPGCVSLHMVELPVIGPPFCHQRQPMYSCYFGGNSPADDPDYYVRCLQQCYKYYQQLDTKLPLIVNTMGWTKGLGLDLMVDTLQLIKPDFVIQLDCRNQSMNFPALTPDFISDQQGWIAKSQSFGGESTEVPDRYNHKLIMIESPVNQQEQYSIKLKALDHRNLSILGYLSQCIEPGMTLTSVPPYVVSWNTIGVYVIHEVVQRSQVMYALNGSIVALCNADLSQAHRDDDNSPWWFKQSPDNARCIGFGLVRGIDPENRNIYIITPVSPVQLKQVNTLIRGSTNIPEQVLLKQKSSGTLPYVDITTSSTGASALRQRKHMPRKYNTDLRF